MLLTHEKDLEHLGPYWSQTTLFSNLYTLHHYKVLLLPLSSYVYKAEIFHLGYDQFGLRHMLAGR